MERMTSVYHRMLGMEILIVVRREDVSQVLSKSFMENWLKIVHVSLGTHGEDGSSPSQDGGDGNHHSENNDSHQDQGNSENLPENQQTNTGNLLSLVTLINY